MKRNQYQLNGEDQRPRLEGGIQGGKSDFNEFKSKRKNTYRAWYILFICTSVCTVITVILLLLFGVGGNNRRLMDNLSLGNISDKLGSLFASIDFPFFTAESNDAPESDFTVIPGIGTSSDGNEDTTAPPAVDAGAEGGGLYDYDYSLVPEGHTPIIPMDLSLSAYGSGYINNSTGYTPNITALINKNLNTDSTLQPMSVNDGPKVLIIHTHGSEAYSPSGAISLPGGDEAVYSADTTQNVVAIGKTVADILNKNGVPTAHCTIMHDSIQYKDSYARAEETVKKYLAEYPSIKLVIDIHRDSIVKSSGEIVRPITEYDDKKAAQVMCVVGSDWEGDAHPNWQNNLSLALKLRELLNQECDNICRPVFLKSHTYNQEIAPYSMLLEIGASGNSLEEAMVSARLVAEKLCNIVNQI